MPLKNPAFEVGKGTQDVLSLSEAEVAQHLDPAELVRELETSLGALARGEVQCPPRPQITVPGSRAAGPLHPKARAVRDPETEIKRSDVLCLTTHSAAPVIEPDWVQPGTHVSSVGYHPHDGELPRVLARDHRLVVETMDALAAPPVGCADLIGIDATRGTTLGEIVNDPRKGRRTDSEVTIYKAMGIAMEDMVAANPAYRNARRSGTGAAMKF